MAPSKTKASKNSRFDWMKYGVIGDLYHLKWREKQDKVLGPTSDLIFNNKITVDEAVKKMDQEANKIISK